jgi:DnaJ-class molecular chaperone
VQAYEVLTDVDKRRHYDEGVDVEDLDRPQGHSGCGHGHGGHGGMMMIMMMMMFT